MRPGTTKKQLQTIKQHIFCSSAPPLKALQPTWSGGGGKQLTSINKNLCVQFKPSFRFFAIFTWTLRQERKTTLPHTHTHTESIQVPCLKTTLPLIHTQKAYKYHAFSHHKAELHTKTHTQNKNTSTDIQKKKQMFSKTSSQVKDFFLPLN